MRKFLALWTTPLLLTIAWPSASSADADAGKELFESAESGNCVTCHHTTALNKVGPGLQDVSERHSEQWLHSWMKDPQGTWRSEHPETLELRERTSKLRTRMTSCVKKPMPEQGVMNLIDYLGTLVSEPLPEAGD